MKFRTLTAAFLGFALIGCGNYRSDVDVICNAYAHIPSGAMASPAERMSALARYLTDNIKSAPGRRLVGSLGGVRGRDRAELMRAEARRVGITSCPITAVWANE